MTPYLLFDKAEGSYIVCEKLCLKGGILRDVDKQN